VGPVVDVVFALGLHVVTAVMIVAALALVPRSRSLLTALGAFTMYPFLLHGLVVRVAQSAGVHDYLIGLGGVGALAITVGAVALAFLLATPAVRAATRWAVEPASLALLRRRSGARTAAASGPAEARDAHEREDERPREMAGSVRG
jgi:fucose 4-O-acetylase-like acetyltransferase